MAARWLRASSRPSSGRRKTTHQSPPEALPLSKWAWPALLLLVCMSIPLGHAQNDTSCRSHSRSPSASSKWSLLWRDEFRQKGRSLDGKKWSHMLGDGSYYGIPGWGNGEYQSYTKDNAYVSADRLIIKAKVDGDGEITSSRLRSKFDVYPGYKGFKTIKIKTRLKIPGASPGMWAALWMLPETSNKSCSGCGRYGAWSSSGEIDIWESVNTMSDVIATAHYGGQWPGNRAWGASAKIDGTQWNVMSVLWEKDKISWYLNNEKIHEIWSASETREGWYSENTQRSRAPFDRPFHVLINLACGGSLTGNVDRRTVVDTLRAKSRSMHVDYVRIYGRR